MVVLACGLGCGDKVAGVSVDGAVSTISFIGFYDGQPATGGPRSIGRADSADGRVWHRSNSLPVFEADPSTDWEHDIVKDPFVLANGSVLYLYYSGYNSTTNIFQIGLATSIDNGQTFHRVSALPVLPAGSPGSFDERGVSFPIVLYEPEEPTSKQWKMWYTAKEGSKRDTIGYARSNDGMTWVKAGSALDLGPRPADFDSNLLKTGGV